MEEEGSGLLQTCIYLEQLVWTLHIYCVCIDEDDFLEANSKRGKRFHRPTFEAQSGNRFIVIIADVDQLKTRIECSHLSTFFCR